MKELQPICLDDQHQYAPREKTVTPTGDASQDLMVISSQSPEGYQPQPGDVCQTCFQIQGQPTGERDQHLVRCFEDLASWEQ